MLFAIAGLLLIVVILGTLLVHEKRTGLFKRAVRELLDQDPPASA